jgi:hypothetical protein
MPAEWKFLHRLVKRAQLGNGRSETGNLPLWGAATDKTDGSYGLKRAPTCERNYIGPMSPISLIRWPALSRSPWESITISRGASSSLTA